MKSIAAVAALSGVIACGPSGDGRSQTAAPTLAELASVKDATLAAAGGRFAESSGPRREGFVVSAEWSFEIQGGWDSYVAAATKTLDSKGYRTTRAGADFAAFSKNVPGDVYSVRIARGLETPSSAGLKVVATFSASPD